MLGEHPIDVLILATDLGVARDFYGDGIGSAPDREAMLS